MNIVMKVSFAGGATALALTLVGGGLLPSAAQAQATVLEEVVVTARRREESLQEIPLSVKAFTSDSLQMAGLDQLSDISSYVPNVSFLAGTDGWGADSEMVMRAIPGVGIYVDGVWQANTAGLVRSEFVEIDRVEVLRGPQGTLYGKNTTGGAVNIITARPADEFGARLTGTMGSFGRRDIKAAVDVPLSDTIKTKFTAVSLNTDGFVNLINLANRKLGDTNAEIFRGDLLWEPSDDFDVRVTYMKEDREENGDGRVQGRLIEDGNPFGQTIMRTQYFTAAGVPILNSTHTAGFPGGSLGRWENQSTLETPGVIVDDAKAAIDINWAINDSLSFRSITGYNERVWRNMIDNDAAEITAVNDDLYFRRWNLSQEFQLSGGNDRISWVGGLFFWNENERIREFRYTFHEFRDPDGPGPQVAPLDFGLVEAQCNPPLPGLAACRLTPPPGDGSEGNHVEGYAAFGEVNIALSDALELTVGFRHQDEDVESWAVNPTFAPDLSVLGVYFAGIPAGQMFAGTKGTVIPANFASDTGRLALNYDVSDDIMLYGSYADGFTAGGTNVAFPNNELLIVPYDPEEVETFEFGLRSDWLDGRLRFNLTLFDSDWTSIQISETIPDPTNPGQNLAGTLTRNAGAATVSGSEIELVALPSDNWRFDVNIGTLDTAYTDVGTSQDIQIGDMFQQAPELTYSLGAQFDTERSNGGSLLVRLDYKWTDDFVRVRERQRQIGEPSVGVTNARLVYTPPDGNWRASLWGTNLTDEWYKTSGFTSTGFGFDFTTLAPPREVGVTLEAFFE